MKKFFNLKILLVALIFFNATLVLSQSYSTFTELQDELNSRIENEEYELVEKTLDSLKTTHYYTVDSLKLKLDFINAILYKTQKKDEKALEIFLKGLEGVDKDKFAVDVSNYNYEIGGQFSRAQNYPKAFKYFRATLSLSKAKNDSLNISKGHLGVGSVHLRMYQDIHTGVSIMDTIVLMEHRDSAKHHYQEAINSFPKRETDKKYLAIVYTNFMGYYFYEEQYEKAEPYAELSLGIRKEANDSVAMANTINTIGGINIRKSEFHTALDYYILGLNLVKNKQDYKSVGLKKTFYNNLAHAYSNLENYKEAYYYRGLTQTLTDSLQTANSNTKFAEYEAKYNVAQEEKKTALERRKRERTESWLLVLGISSGAMLLVLFLLSRVQRIKKEKKLLLLENEKTAREREIEQLQSETQIKILNATLDGKETERKEISEVLHNSVSALLSSAGLHLQAAKISLEDKAPEEIAKSQEIIKEAGEKIRNLSHTLVSSVLLKFGLNYALGDLCEKYSNSKLKFSSDALEINRYNTSFEIKIHSIIEELMNNIIKHSNATTANIVLKEESDRLRVRIFDDGDGFDVEELRTMSSSGLGLPQIELRVKMMEGEFMIQSSKKAGTRIYLNVPIPKED